jgi:FtsP/CotA-like multicopper oxidase with cupredoxin domain
MPSALIALLCIALLCRALSFAGDDAQHGSSFVALRRPCTATLIIRRELLPGSPAPRVTVNGASPGPVLRCALGHSVRYTVVNQLPDDATTVHWHGLGQRGTPWADGVVGVSQVRGASACGLCAFAQLQQNSHHVRRPTCLSFFAAAVPNSQRAVKEHARL